MTAKWALGILAFSVVASATTINFTTTGSPTDTAGDPVSASGSVTTGAGTVTVTLTDTLANPKDAGQLLSDFFFTLGTTPTSLGTTVTPTGATLISIDSSGGVTSGGTAFATWGLSSNGAVIHLDSLVGGPSQTLIGSGPYTAANGSIAGNGPHNPFLTGTATFTFLVGGVTADTTISAPVFSFGTVSGDNISGCIVGGPSCTSVTTPEPLTLGLTGAGLIGIFFIRRRRPMSL
jgi:hypothetical protein